MCFVDVIFGYSWHSTIKYTHTNSFICSFTKGLVFSWVPGNMLSAGGTSQSIMLCVLQLSAYNCYTNNY